MAYKNKLIHNPKTGQSIKFLQTAKVTNGRLLEMEAIYNTYSKEPAAHYHPFQEEKFTVTEGEISVRIDGQLKVLKTGDVLHIAKNVVHSMWNNTDARAKMNWKVEPALETEYFLETAAGLASDDKTDELGMPPLLQVSIMGNSFSNIFRLSKPPYALQKILFMLLSPIAYLNGYKATYKSTLIEVKLSK